MSKVLIDTNIWSAFLRRSNPADDTTRRNFFELVESSRACIIGPIRQEVLSGIRDIDKFNKLRDYLEGFDDEGILTSDYIEAARLRNLCTANGIAACSIDMIIVAFVKNHNAVLYTRDHDFTEQYSKIARFGIYHEID